MDKVGSVELGLGQQPILEGLFDRFFYSKAILYRQYLVNMTPESKLSSIEPQ